MERGTGPGRLLPSLHTPQCFLRAPGRARRQLLWTRGLPGEALQRPLVRPEEPRSGRSHTLQLRAKMPDAHPSSKNAPPVQPRMSSCLTDSVFCKLTRPTVSTSSPDPHMTRCIPMPPAGCRQLPSSNCSSRKVWGTSVNFLFLPHPCPIHQKMLLSAQIIPLTCPVLTNVLRPAWQWSQGSSWPIWNPVSSAAQSRLLSTQRPLTGEITRLL